LLYVICSLRYHVQHFVNTSACYMSYPSDIYAHDRTSCVGQFIMISPNIVLYETCHHFVGQLSRYSNWLQVGRQGFDSRQMQDIFLYSTATRSGVRSTQPLIQWVSVALSPGGNCRDVKLTNAEVKIGGAVPPLPRKSSRRGALLIKTRNNFTFTCYHHVMQFN
jgi:hypothetical protein